jgi:hypothetical protein
MMKTGITHINPSILMNTAIPINLGSRIVEDIESIVYANDANTRRQQDFK